MDDQISPADACPRPARQAAAGRSRARRMPGFAALVLGLPTLAALLLFALRWTPTLQAHAETAAPPAMGQRWTEITKPYQIYTMDMPQFAGLPRTYAARRLENGNGRLDMLTLGKSAGAGPWMHLAIRRFGNPEAIEAGFYVDVARRAAEAGLAVGHSDAPEQIASRFGTMEYASVLLERGTAATPCQAFRFAELGPDLNISGVYCAGSGREPEPGTVVCLLDRLALASAGDDANLRKVFVAAELKREQFCAGSKYRVAQVEALAPVAAPLPAVAPMVERKEKRNKRKR